MSARSNQCLGIVDTVVTSDAISSDVDTLYSLSQRCAGVVALQIFWLIWHPAYAQGATGPPGLQGLDELLILLIVYPYIGLGLSFLLFKATGKASVFFLAPFFFVGLSIIAPVDPTAPSPQSPEFFSLAGVWFYWTHILAVALIYWVFAKKRKSWLFFLAPIVGWIIQVVSLVFIVALH